MKRKFRSQIAAAALAAVVLPSASIAADPSKESSDDSKSKRSDYVYVWKAKDRGEISESAEPSSGASAAATTGVNPAAGSHGNLAEQATNPVAPLIQLQLQNNFVFDSMEADGYANQIIIQPVVPIPAMGFLPRAIWRPTIPIVSTPDIENGPDGTTGLGDIASIYVFNFDQKWGVLGAGISNTFPTATDSRLGARKWAAGPAVFALYTKIPKVQVGALLFNDWSFAGPGENDVNKLSMQVIGTKHFDGGWYGGWGDEPLGYNWETNKAYLPISLRLGKVGKIGKQPVNIFGQFVYNVGDEQPGQTQWGFKLNMTLLFPE